MPLAATELRRALVGKFGFSEAGSGRGPHDKYRLEVDGQWMAHTLISGGASDLSDSILGQIARQLGVTRREVYEMVGCSMGLEAYLERLG